MAPDSGDIIWHSNPFPLTPVVRLGPSSGLGNAPVERADSGNATVSTPTTEDLSRLVDDYFADQPGGGRRGRVIALVGEFGLGKSHALRKVSDDLGGLPEPLTLWSMDEPVQDMGRMYRDRLRGPGDTPQGQRRFEKLVHRYYTYVMANRVAAQGHDPRLGGLDEIASALRAGSLDPDKVVSALRYDPEVIHADLRRAMGSVTEHRRFATALALFQDPSFTRMVWEWLRGEEPAEPLRERGITEAIGPSAGTSGPEHINAGIDRVFDALAVQAVLHGTVSSPYALLIDSLEKVLEWREDHLRTFMDAFERLVNIYASQGGLLVFCVSPRGLRELRPSVHERLVQLWPAAFDERLTGQLVAAYVAAGGGSGGGTGTPAGPSTGPNAEPSAYPTAGPSFGPFDREAIGLMHELTEGVPREVLKTCRQAWQIAEDRDRAREDGSEGGVRRVSARDVLLAVGRLHEQVSRRHIVTDVRKALDLGQWRIASRDPVPDRLSSPPGTPEEVLHWLSPGPNAYLAVLLTNSVLVADDAERIAAQVHSLRSAVSPGRCEVLLVVRGHVSHTMQDRLGRSIGSRPLVYEQRDFPRTVDAALRKLGTRLSDGRREEGLVQLGERMRRDLEQQTAELAELRRVMNTWVPELRSRALAPGGARTAPSPGGPTAVLDHPPGREPDPEPVAADLPGAVRHRFHEALEVLDTVTRRIAGRAAERHPTATQKDLGVLGCATLVRALTEHFRGSVAAWHRSAARGAPSDFQWGELRRICREYESAVEVLPTHLLGSPGPPHPLTAARTVEVLAEEVWSALSAAAV
ncbi:hypothetical protein [Streptomyces sp. NPDC090022]|uniref:hypothetical protein n=1 Tax=Streptomyces sp. NPDC090022 TaxID=3365920 RepID=UPI00381F8F7D